MGFRFWKRFKILPGVTVNVSKSGPSVSIGPKGAKVTVGKKGVRGTVGIPGSGLFYTKKLLGLEEVLGDEEADAKARKKRKKGKDKAPAAEKLPPPPLPPESPEERAFVQGCRDLDEGKPLHALESFRQAAREPDGALLAGLVALKLGELSESERFLTHAARGHLELGSLFRRYEVAADLRLPITEEVEAVVAADRKGALLALVEVYQGQGRRDEAIEALRQLLELEPDDPVIRLSLMELLAEAAPEAKQTWQELVRLAQGIEDASALHSTVLLYKGRALHELGLLTAARDTLTAALRKKKGRPVELRLAQQYERALVYEALGDAKKSRAEMEKVYAADPDFEDAAARLGL